MKKITAILIILTLLAASLLVSCNTDTTLENNAEQSYTSELPAIQAENTTEKIIHAYSEYLPLERCITASTDILKGNCVKIIDNDDSVEYEFAVTKRFMGEDVKSNIFVYVEKNKTVSVTSDEKVIHEITDMPAQQPYKVGSEYYLLLSRHVSVYYDHDRYMVFSSVPYIPASNISQSTVYGESILKHSKMETLTTEEEFCDYISSCIALIDRTDKPYYSGMPFSTATDVPTIIKEADHVAKVKVQKQIVVDGAVKNMNIYECIVTESLSGSIQNEEVIHVTFFPNTVSEGEEFVLALDDSITTNPKHYNFSSKSSLFPLSEYDNIISAINNG